MSVSTKSKSEKSAFAREAVAVFHSADTMQEAIDELLSSGFDRAEINLLAGAEAVEEKLGDKFEKVQQEEEDLEAPRAAYLSPEAFADAEAAVFSALMYLPAVAATGIVVASGGTVAAAVLAAAAGVGGGGAVGAVLARLIGAAHAEHLQHQLDKGGLLLWVLTRDEAHEQHAVEILKRHAGDDVHVHGVRMD